MTSNDIIRLEDVYKAYNIYNRPQDFLLEFLTRKTKHDVFWALNGISLAIKEKQRVGIIGPNGAGKSTLLKIICGNLTPTKGTLSVNGKISALLSLNTILNPEETGLNNIQFNLLLNGLAKSRVGEVTEEIVEFTEIGPFIYSPVKTYSSGMLARLSFAVATAIEPEILIIDEVLGAGDAYFASKALARMMQLCDKGKVLLFVSHNISDIQRLCETVIWMDRGVIREIGPADYVLGHYEEDYRYRESEITRKKNLERRKILENMANLSDLASPDQISLRLIAKNSRHIFADTHYIRKIHFEGSELPPTEVDISAPESTLPGQSAWLNIFDSEWGRIHDRRGVKCRLLYSQTGKKKGGRILALKPSGSREWDLHVICEAASISLVEDLTLQYLDLETGVWLDVAEGKKKPLGSDWLEYHFVVPVKPISKVSLEKVRKAIEETTRPMVEIVDVSIFAKNEKTFVLKEREPFEVRVTIDAHHQVSLVDINMKIIRSDGVYFFWQSSGWNGDNIKDLTGQAVVSYLFEDNPLPGGEYTITAGCSNGWNLENNYPHSELFDLKVNALKFTVMREYPELDFGVINIRIPVRIDRLST